MSLLNIKDFYGQSLGVPPWKVTEVSIDSETRQVRVLVECARGVPWVDPETRERAEIKDRPGEGLPQGAQNHPA